MADEAAFAERLAEFQTLVLARNKTRVHCVSADVLHNRYADGENPLCGDSLRAYLLIQAERVQSAHYRGELSAIAAASAEVLCGLLIGLTAGQCLVLLAQAKQLIGAASLSVADEEQPLAGLQSFSASQKLLGEFQSFAVLQRYPSRTKTALLAITTFEAALRAGPRSMSVDKAVN